MMFQALSIIFFTLVYLTNQSIQSNIMARKDQQIKDEVINDYGGSITIFDNVKNVHLSIILGLIVSANLTGELIVIEVKKGDSFGFKCNATVDHLNIIWTKDNVKLDKIGENYEIFETKTKARIISKLMLRATKISDAAIYKCVPEKVKEKDERIIKLVFIGEDEWGRRLSAGLNTFVTSLGNFRSIQNQYRSVQSHSIVPPKFDEKYTLIKVKRGESARLNGNASGDQPLTVIWTKDNVKLDKHGGHNFEIFETKTKTGIISELLLRTTQRTDGNIYKCEAMNKNGKDERTIKLVVVEVPDPPLNVHVKVVLSRTAKIVWSHPYSGNSPITKYTVQYWRHNSAQHKLNEFSVSSAQNSALIKDLFPGLSYEMTVFGENELGRGESAKSVKLMTAEKEPSAPPNDITVESRGPTTIRVQWRSPDNQHWNGVLKGFYVGYRKARETSLPFIFKLVESKSLSNSESFETETYEYFIEDVLKCTEYAIIVKAYNSAGSGPQSQEMLAHTYDGDLPLAQQLTAIERNNNSISLQWNQRDICESQSPVISYTIHYQREGEHIWKEITHSSQSILTSISDISSLSTYNYTLQNLESGVQYLVFITALNRFGSSESSNIVTTKIKGECESVQSSGVIKYWFTIPIITIAVIVIIAMIFAFVCVRRISHRDKTNGLTMENPTISKPFNCSIRTTTSYMNSDKACDIPLMMTDKGNIEPPPYETIPMKVDESNQ